MKTLSLTVAAIILAAASSLSPAAAQAVASHVEQGTDNATSVAATAAPHYEWQYHYVGRHPRYEGHWVLVR
jgi:hypothetical protein